MKTFVLCLGLAASSGCSPTAEAYCETLAGCGGATVDMCLEGLRAGRDEADMNGCVDQYYALVDCQVDLEFSCTDDLGGLVSESCSAELCEYDGCSTHYLGWEELTKDRCSGERFDPAGTWSLQITPFSTSMCSTSGMTREITVTKSEGKFQLKPTGSGSLTMETFTASHDSAQMEATLVEGNTSVRFDVTAVESSMPNEVATISGDGSRFVNTCNDGVLITGHVRRATP